MTVGLFLGLLLSLGFLLWIVIRRRRENVLHSAVMGATEQALRDSETRLDLAAQLGRIGFFEHDHRTDSLSWSPILRDIYGVGPDEPASWQRSLELVHPDDLDRIISTVQRARAATDSGLYEVEHRLVRPDGAMRHIRLRSLTSFDGDGSSRQPVRTLGTVIDVTDRKNVETRRRETARREAIDASAGGIAHELNNGLTAVLGFSELALPLIPAESKAHHHIRQVIAAGQKAREAAHRMHRSLGHASSYPASTAVPSNAEQEPSRTSD